MVTVVIFGLSKLKLTENIDLCSEDIDGQEHISVPDTLANLDGDQKRLLIEYIQQHHTLKVKVLIDALGSKYGYEEFPYEGGTISARNYLRSMIRNNIAAE